MKAVTGRLNDTRAGDRMLTAVRRVQTDTGSMLMELAGRARVVSGVLELLQFAVAPDGASVPSEGVDWLVVEGMLNELSRDSQEVTTALEILAEAEAAETDGVPTDDRAS